MHYPSDSGELSTALLILWITLWISCGIVPSSGSILRVFRVIGNTANGAVMRPRLLDLFCKAGGSSAGYVAAGFDVTGVDIEPQPNYPFDFYQAEAIMFLQERGKFFDVIAASPPCQRFSILRHAPNRDMGSYPDLVEPVRSICMHLGKPFVIENVVGAPLHHPIRLCGTMFGLKVYRHRLFESNVTLSAPEHGRHRDRIKPAGQGGTMAYYGSGPTGFVIVAGHMFNTQQGREAMQIPWMSRGELAQAIPPAYTSYVGKQIMERI